MQKRKFASILFLILGLSLVASSDSQARSKSRKKKPAQHASSGLCPQGIATTTMYFVPHVKDYCSSSQPCKAFKNEVKLQGAGTLPGNKILTYTGAILNLGSCKTAIGASGKCLTPFISVAADPRFYSMGDIISMPALKGKKIRMPDGTTMIHPGYLVVDDTGGAIKGANRFDFFTGSYNMTDSKNAFGVNGPDDTKMSGKKECVARKAFTVVRRSSAQYGTALASIEDAVNDSQNLMYASNQGSDAGGSR
jgi:membrane-bound lytic murein transglycosylase A